MKANGQKIIKLIKSTFYKENLTKKKLCKFIENAPQLSIGEQCRTFEEKFAKYQNRKYCVFFNSGSSANLAVIQALLNVHKINKSDFAGFSAITWATNPMPLIQLGLRAVPIDVEVDTLNVSSKKIIHCLTTHPIKILFLTNLLGFCDDIEKIVKLCSERKILLIEDNCESLGTIYKGVKLGNFGYASTFSFFVGHHMSTIEGGAVCTDDEDFAIMLKLVRAHGWDRNLDEKNQIRLRKKYHVETSFYSRYTFYDLGYNLRPTEINGFLGNVQLGYLDEIIAKRQKNFKTLAAAFAKRPDLFYPIRFNHIDLVSNFAFPVICRSKLIRGKMINKCAGKIEIRPIVGGDMTHQPFYQKYMNQHNMNVNNPNATIIKEQGLYFGNNPELTTKEIEVIIRVFTK